MIRDILSIRAGQCRFCVTDDTPFLFCAEPVAELVGGKLSAYCAKHHRVCHNGFGKDWRALEPMMKGIEQSVLYKGTVCGETAEHGGPANAVPVDVQIRGSV